MILTPRGWARIRNATLGLAVTLAFFAGAEILLALTGVAPDAPVLMADAAMGHMAGPLPPWMRPDEELLWVFRQGPVEERSPDGSRRWRYGVNAAGFRGSGTSGGAGRPLVLCAGDSVTAGYGVNDGETYPDALQDILRKERGWERATVVNRGVNGYSSEQGRALLESEIPRLRPDVVVISFGIDDDWLSVYPDALVMGRDSSLSGQRAVLRRLRLYRLLRRAILLIRTKRLAAEGKLVARVPLPRYRQNLEAIVDLTRSVGGYAILVAPTSRTEHGARRFVPGRPGIIIARPLSEYRSAMGDVARASGVPFVDEPLLSGRLPESPGRFVDWCHPDVEGLAILASAVATRLPREIGSP